MSSYKTRRSSDDTWTNILFNRRTQESAAYIVLSLLMRFGFWGLGLILFPRRRKLGTTL